MPLFINFSLNPFSKKEKEKKKEFKCIRHPLIVFELKTSFIVFYHCLEQVIQDKSYTSLTLWIRIGDSEMPNLMGLLNYAQVNNTRMRNSKWPSS